MAKLDENLEIGNTSKKLKDIVDVYSTSETKTNKKSRQKYFFRPKSRLLGFTFP